MKLWSHNLATKIAAHLQEAINGRHIFQYDGFSIRLEPVFYPHQLQHHQWKSTSLLNDVQIETISCKIAEEEIRGAIRFRVEREIERDKGPLPVRQIMVLIEPDNKISIAAD